MYFQFQTIERLKGWKEADLKSASSLRFHLNVFMFWKIDFMIENILKKYPKILDFRFLILYICSVNQLIVDTSPATRNYQPKTWQEKETWHATSLQQAQHNIF